MDLVEFEFQVTGQDVLEFQITPQESLEFQVTLQLEISQGIHTQEVLEFEL